MPADLSQFGLTEMLRTSRLLNEVAGKALTMESCARQICRTLYDELRAGDGERACALVRCYKTHEYGTLPPDLQRFAWRQLGSIQAPPDSMKCLTLLGTAGESAPWNIRQKSRSHQCIPLASPRMVEQAPMIAQLIRDFGLELADVVSPTPDVVRNIAGRTYDIFHVPEAQGSPFIPAQEEFVGPHRVRSVVGFGGSLTSGDLFAVILFSHVHVPRENAERFRTTALDVKTLFFPYGDKQVFDPLTLDSGTSERPLHI